MLYWNQVFQKQEKFNRPGAFYHKSVQYYYAFLIPPELRILEFGCGHGDLLVHLKPSVGVGVDFSGEMIRVASKKYPDLSFIQADASEVEFSTKFAAIILSDFINDLWDVQRAIGKMRNVTHEGTQLIINFYNNLWRVPRSFVKWLGLSAELLEQIGFLDTTSAIYWSCPVFGNLDPCAELNRKIVEMPIRYR